MILADQADVLRLYLISVGAAVDPPPTASAPTDWPIVTGLIPATGSRDNFIGIIGTGAFTEGGRDPATGDRMAVHPTAQLIIRSSDHKTAQLKGKTIEQIFDKIGAFNEGVGWPLVVVDGERVLIQSVRVTVPTTWFGREEQNRRQLFSLNVRTTLAKG